MGIDSELEKMEFLPEAVLIEKNLAATGTDPDSETLAFHDVPVLVSPRLQIPEKGVRKFHFHHLKSVILSVILFFWLMAKYRET